MSLVLTAENRTYQQVALYFALKLTLTLIAGGLIGVFHARPFMVAFLLALYLVVKLIKTKKQTGTHFGLYLSGLLLAGCLGLICEYFGTHYGFWHYFSLPVGTSMPVWLLFSWPLAYHVLYSLEYKSCALLNIRSLQQKLSLVFSIALIYPTAGEIGAINMGTWVYHMPLQSWQLLGVPVIAMGLLLVFHVGIFSFLACAARLFNLQDSVYAANKQGN